MIQNMKKLGFWISFVFNLLPFGLAIDIGRHIYHVYTDMVKSGDNI